MHMQKEAWRHGLAYVVLSLCLHRTKCIADRGPYSSCTRSQPSQDSWLRSVADFENLQKITTREKTKAKEYAIESFAKDLIENMDILHLALNTVPADKRTKAARPSSSESGPTEADHLADLFVGVDMTAKNLEKTLSRFGVKAFDPTGEKFDPNLHEAMYQAPVPGKEPGSVLECQKKGWLLKDRLLRPAQVGVVMDTSN